MIFPLSVNIFEASKITILRRFLFKYFYLLKFLHLRQNSKK
jgi:hypothetical protein